MTYQYGVLEISDPVLGSQVRYVSAGVGRPGAILTPRNPGECNATLLRVSGNMGYVELIPTSASVGHASTSLSGSASVVSVPLPIVSRGSLRIE